MKTVEKALMVKQLINETLSLVDKHGGLRGVTLREITRQAGCKHTNLYNYYNSFEDLLWASLGQAIIQNMEFTNQKMEGYYEPEQLLARFTESQIEFAVNHPGVYRLIFLDSINGTPPASVVKIIQSPYTQFLEFVKKIINTNTSANEIQQIADILHGYLHGEICKLITNRYFGKTKEEFEDNIVKNAIKIFSILKCS